MAPRDRSGPAVAAPAAAGAGLTTFLIALVESVPIADKRCLAHSAPVKCDLPLSDRTGDAAPRSVKVVEGSERLASEGYKGLRTQHDSLPVKVKTTRGVAANQGRASGTIVGAAANGPA